MLKIIKKALLLSLFVCSFIFSMSQIAQRALTTFVSKTQVAPIALAKMVSQRASFHDSPIARCPIITSISLLSTEDDESGVIDDKDTENNSQSSSDLREDKKNNQYTAHGIIDLRQEHEEVISWQPQSPTEKIQARHDYNASQASQHSSEIIHRIRLEEQHEANVAKVKSTVSTYILDFQEIVQHKTSKIVDFNCLSSSQEIATQKAALSQRLCVLENKLLEFTQQNSQFSFIADATQHGFYEIPYHIKERWTDQDYQQAFMALELKAEIEAIKAAMQECDWMINSVKQEPHNFANKLENESVDTIEQEIIPDLAAKKEKIEGFIVVKKGELSKQNSKVKEIEAQLGSFYKRSEITQWWHKSTIAALVTQQKAAKEKQVKTNQEFQFLCDEQKKYSGRIEQAQKIINEKNQIALQEAQLLKEKQEQETLTFYDEQLKISHDACDFRNSSYSDHELDNQWCQRQEALSKTIEQGYTQYYQEYNLTPQAKAFLAIHGVDSNNLQTFFGTALQQQLHSEMCDIFSQAAAMQAQFPYQNDLLISVVNFADAAHDANKNNQLLLASQLLDVDCYLLKLNHQIIASIYNDPVGYAQAGLLAISDGLSDVGHMISNPVETIKGLGKALYYVLETITLNGSQDVVNYPEIYGPMRDARNAEIVAGLKNLGQQIENSSGPERFGALVRFGIDFYVSGKIIHAVGEVCGFVKTQAKVMRTLEGVASMAEEQGLTQELIQTTEKLKVATQENIAKSFANELKEVKKIITIYNPDGSVLKRFKLLPEQQFISTVRTKGGKISAAKTNKILCDNAEYWVEQMNAAIEKVNNDLIKQYKKMNPIVGHPEKSVCIDLEHAISGKYELVMNKTNEYYQIQFKGGHKAGTIARLKQKGYVEIHDIKEFGGGCKEYQVEDLFSGQMFTHTEFPPHWNAEKIAQETKSFTENAIKNGSFSAETKEAIEVITEDGFELKIVVDPNPELLNHTCTVIENTSNRHIVTSHPVYKG